MDTKEQKVSLFDIETGLLETAVALQEVECGLELISDEPHEAEMKRRGVQRRDELRAVLEAYLTEAPAKRDRVAAFIKQCEAQVEHCKAEKARINTRQKAIENMVDRLKQHFVFVMQSIGTRKLEGNTSVISLRKLPDKLDITDTGHIPARFLIVEPPPPPPPVKVNAKALLDWCKAQQGGDEFEPLPGVRVIPGGDTLQVR